MSDRFPDISSLFGMTLTTKQITQGGTYTAATDNADGYSEVVVNVSMGRAPRENPVTEFDSGAFINGLNLASSAEAELVTTTE